MIPDLRKSLIKYFDMFGSIFIIIQKFILESLVLTISSIRNKIAILRIRFQNQS